MQIAAAVVKALRERTGAGIMDCRRALEEAQGDEDRAVEILRKWGLDRAEKRANRVASQGLVEAYLHAGGRIGALVEVNCETDFVARTEAFKDLAHSLAMQVAATNPRYLGPEDVPVQEQEDHHEVCLLLQPFIKDPDKTVQDLIAEARAKMGEHIQIKRFARLELGG